MTTESARPQPPKSRPWSGWSTRRKVAVGTIGAVLVLGAIGSATNPNSGTGALSQPPTATGSPTSGPSAAIVNTMSVHGIVNGSTLAITGETNLPDGALISLLASRAFHNKGEDDIRATNIGEESATVSGGKFAGSLSLDESNLLLNVGTGPGEDVIDQLDADVTLCGQFQTGVDLDGKPRQDSSVSDVVGANGEALASSPLVTVFGSATKNPSNWLEVLHDVGLVSPLLNQITTQQGSAPKVVALDGFCV